MTSEDDNNTSSLQPGADLRRAREKAGVSLGYLSEQTLITQSRLDALEKEDYRQLGGLAYITGYTRAYCKVIGVDPKPFVDAFEKHVSTSSEYHAHQDHLQSETPAPTMMTSPKSTMLIAVLLGFIILIFVLWLALGGSDEPVSSSQSQSAPASPVTTEAGDESSAQLSPDNVLENNSEPESLENEDAPEFETPASEADPEPEPESPSASSSPVQAAQVPAEVNTQGQTDSLSARAALSRNARTGAQTESGAALQDILKLTFDDDCWVEVSDATGERLAAKLAQAGEELSYIGESPFSVMLGNARAASVEFNGQPVDLNVRPGARTLKLAVGPSSL